MFARMFHRSPAASYRPTHEAAFHRRGPRRPAIDVPGRQFGISVPYRTQQFEWAKASFSNGSSVVVWTESTPSTPQNIGQLFNAQDVEVSEHVVIRGSGNGLF